MITIQHLRTDAVQMHYGNSSTNPFATLNYGEVEDYTVNITGGSGFSTKEFVSNNSENQIRNAGNIGKELLFGRNVQNINPGKQTQGSHTYLMNRNKEVIKGNYFIVFITG